VKSAFPAGRSWGVTVAVAGFFAFVWFGWGQAGAPSWLMMGGDGGGRGGTGRRPARAGLRR
jgi:hypothetical protein